MLLLALLLASGSQRQKTSCFLCWIRWGHAVNKVNLLQISGRKVEAMHAAVLHSHIVRWLPFRDARFSPPLVSRERCACTITPPRCCITLTEHQTISIPLSALCLPVRKSLVTWSSCWDYSQALLLPATSRRIVEGTHSWWLNNDS